MLVVFEWNYYFIVSRSVILNFYLAANNSRIFKKGKESCTFFSTHQWQTVTVLLIQRPKLADPRVITVPLLSVKINQLSVSSDKSSIPVQSNMFLKPMDANALDETVNGNLSKIIYVFTSSPVVWYTNHFIKTSSFLFLQYIIYH